MLFNQIHNSCIGKGIKAAVQKLGIVHHILKEFFRVTGIGHIAASLSRDIDFFPKLFIFLIDADLMACSGCGNCRHHACGTAADDDHMTHTDYSSVCSPRAILTALRYVFSSSN